MRIVDSFIQKWSWFLQDTVCTNAGYFNLLGGPTESPWAYDRLYRRDITRYLEAAGLHSEDVFDPNLHVHVEVDVFDVRGNKLNSDDVLPRPTIIYDPPHGEQANLWT